MTYEQTYKELKAFLENDCNGELDASAIMTAIGAIEKRIPKKLCDCFVKENDNDLMIYYGVCPVCGSIHREYYPFACCRHCGQAFDWSGAK